MNAIGPSITARRELAGMRILLADDGVDNRMIVGAFLRAAGAEVTMVVDGQAALDTLAASGPFDVVLMDMQMPVLDGYQATRLLRSRGCAMPIVALTAHALAEDRGKCLDAGCTDYLAKPIDQRRLIATIRQVAGTQAPAEAPPQQPATLTSWLARDPYVRQLIGEFVARLPEQVSALAEQLGQRDLKALTRELHQLKGSCGSYGFDALSKQASIAYATVREPAWEAIDREVRGLIDLIRRTQGYDARLEKLPQRT